MKSKSIFLMAVSLGFGLVAAIGITQVMGRNNAPVAAPEEPKLPILVSVQDIDIDTELTPEMFVEEEWPARLVGEGAATSMEDIEGMVTRSRIGKKGTILLANLVDKTKLREKRIPVGYKVIGIKMGSDDHMNGLLEAGDLVDLMVVAKGSRTGGSSSKTFLRRVRIWSIGSKTKKDIEQNSSAKGTVVVGLLVTEKQAERVILAEKMADLKLALRGKEDADPNTQSDGTNSIDDEGQSAHAAIDAAAEMERWKAEMMASMNAQNSNSGTQPISTGAPMVEQKTFTMRIFNGDGPTDYTFDKETKGIIKKDGYESAEPASIDSEPVDPNEEGKSLDDLDLLDLDEDEGGSDSDSSDEDLDSEPSS